MVSPRRSGTRSPRFVARALPVSVVAALALGMSAVPAVAQPAPPAPPQNAADARAQLDQAQREAEALTEEWHAATDDLAAKQAEADGLRAAIEPARIAAEQARSDEEQFRQQIDIVALSAFESGRLDQFNALLASGSPQDYLDQMSALEALSADQKVALDELLAKVETTRRAQADADDAVGRAQQAADDARRAADEINVRKREAEARIAEVERLLERLSPQERADRNGPDEGAPAVVIAGTGVGARALKAAATQLGKPYVWGAAGPNSYDCSGLTSWAFKQAGVTLPRSSSQQARVGKSVAWDDMQPGDLVFYYSPVSHVGIYAGGGKMINAPQSGDVVKYQTVSSSAFTGARRL
ncbi:NlpC/P60 family protein [Pseudonocardia bannensis]|uniref:NlpC/P60 family protein n=1 Tax=Pseudonocardia bannensis TaxID=630973 RepID=A0A848DQJ3_9PSEU|nr:NlpC/P60 family protein [Pseudonocardia bannensis]NMH95072.1 NlpC/P60 family protein [Pseudonocardia bannensis]